MVTPCRHLSIFFCWLATRCLAIFSTIMSRCVVCSSYALSGVSFRAANIDFQYDADFSHVLRKSLSIQTWCAHEWVHTLFPCKLKLFNKSRNSMYLKMKSQRKKFKMARLNHVSLNQNEFKTFCRQHLMSMQHHHGIQFARINVIRSTSDEPK